MVPLSIAPETSEARFDDGGNSPLAALPHAAMPPPFIFTMRQVRKITPQGKEILKGISLAFYAGAKIGVLGPNGAGKSTLLRIMAGVEHDFAGDAVPAEGVRIGHLPQAPAGRALPGPPSPARSPPPRRAHQPPRRRVGGVARAPPPGVPGHGGGDHPRPLLPRQRRGLDPGAGPRLRHPVGGQLLLLARAEGAAPGAGGEVGRGAPARPRARARGAARGGAR